MPRRALIACAVAFSAICLGQNPGSLSPQFKAQATRAFHAIQRLDPDDREFQSQPAHRAVNGLVDAIKTPTDRYVSDVLLTWLAEMEEGRVEAKNHPASWRQWMKAEAECEAEAEFYFGGLIDEAKPRIAEKIAHKTCLETAKELKLVVPPPSSPN